MSDAWEKAHSFERTQKLLRAVNTISLHTKRTLAGREGKRDLPRINESRVLLERFLKSLNSDLESLSHDKGSLVGKPARAGLFARRFHQARLQCSDASPLFARPLEEFIQLMASTREKGQELVQGLESLRKLLEEHHYTDSVSLFGEL